MKRIAPILGIIVLLIAALVFLNRGINNTAQPDTDEDAPSQSQADKAKTPPAAPPPAPLTEDLPAEIAVNDPAKARTRITMGWVYDEANQPDPAPLLAAVQAVQNAARSSGGAVSAEIVDLDVPPADRSPAAQAVTTLGVTVSGATPGGKPISLPGNPGQGNLTAEGLTRMLTSVIRGG